MVWYPPLLGAILLLASLKAGSLVRLAVVLVHDGIPLTYAVELASLLSYTEAVLGILLMFNLRSRLVFLGTTALLLGFTGQLVFLLMANGPPCTCFGRYNRLFGRTSNVAGILQNLSLLTLFMIAGCRPSFCKNCSPSVVQH